MDCALSMAKKWIVVLGLLGACGACASAQETCSNQSLTGSFGFIVSGTNIAAKVQFALGGRFVADGQGAFTGTATQNVAGQITRNVSFKGKYSVTPDCSGSALFSFSNDQIANLEFVLVTNGDEILILVSDQGTVEFGTAKKQFPRLSTQSQKER